MVCVWWDLTKCGSWFLICVWCYCKMSVINNDNFFFIIVIWEDTHHHRVAGKEIWMYPTTLVLVSRVVILQGQFCFIRKTCLGSEKKRRRNRIWPKVVRVICSIPLIVTIYWAEMCPVQSFTRFTSWLDEYDWIALVSSLSWTSFIWKASSLWQTIWWDWLFLRTEFVCCLF